MRDDIITCVLSRSQVAEKRKSQLEQFMKDARASKLGESKELYTFFHATERDKHDQHMRLKVCPIKTCHRMNLSSCQNQQSSDADGAVSNDEMLEESVSGRELWEM